MLDVCVPLQRIQRPRACVKSKRMNRPIIAGDITRTDWLLGLVLLPAAGLGFLLSSWLKERANPAQLRVGIFTVSSVAAVALLTRAALG